MLRLAESISQADKATQDILHDIEFTRFNASKGYDFAKRLKELRELRREAKDEMELYNIMFTHIPDIKSRLSTSRGMIVNRRRDKSTWTYIPKSGKEELK